MLRLTMKDKPFIVKRLSNSPVLCRRKAGIDCEKGSTGRPKVPSFRGRCVSAGKRDVPTGEIKTCFFKRNNRTGQLLRAV
jgi:hypothetical protein